MLKIAYDSQIFCSQRYGGISRYFTCLAAAMLDLGQSVKVFAPRYYCEYLRELPAAAVAGSELAFKPPHTKKLLRPVNDLLSTGPIRKWQPDVVHESYYAANPRASRAYPVVITVHDMIHERFPEVFSRYDDTSRVKRAAVQRADHIICISEHTRRDLLEIWDVPEEKVSVVYSGCSQLAPQPVAPYTTESGRPYLLYVANRNAYKNFDGLLMAYAMSGALRDTYDIVAFGGGELTRDERDLIRRLGIPADRVVQRQGDDAMLAAVYTGAAAFIYPSRYEGFGLSPLEAMACDCPVICSDSSCLPEVLGDAAAFYDPDSPEMMSKVIEDTVSDARRLADLRAKGRERLARYSWKACAEASLAVYRNVHEKAG